MNNVMIDFETFGNGKNAAVVQIGACYFNPETGEIGKKFKINVDAESAQRSGADIDASTVYWWLSQSHEARMSILAEGRTPITAAFIEFNDFLKDAYEIWSHATFDFVILQETLKRLNIQPTFSHRYSRDIRTLMAMSGYKHPNKQTGVAHDALADCLFQVEYCVAAMNKMKEPK